MEQAIGLNGKHFVTTRCPIRINGERLISPNAAPSLGQQNREIKTELLNISE
jgi:hypothetical protein